ncbi:MAG: DUF1127 domain-containing protein [Hyphomicrobiaceae bacterium]|nr:DUF1127 domain-containing protein [Hyphomicrobiaceae bacterium]
MTCLMTRMSNLQTHRPAAADGFRFPVRPSLAASAARLLRDGWRAYWDWRARKATILLLRSLDRRTLGDIGIAPSEIESLVHGSGTDRCRRYDPTWPWRR